MNPDVNSSLAGALDGMVVLDVSQVMAGPYCCQILGDMGADVIKVEPVGTGDATRHSMGHRLPRGESAAFLAVNRNKRGIAINIKDPDGHAALLDLVAKADVVVENFRPGVVERLGIDYANLCKVKPDLIYASISGFGHTGPYAKRPGYDLIAQGMTGIMSVTGESGAEPMKSAISVADLSAGLFSAIGVLSAYAAKLRTGRGQYLDTSLYDSALAISVWEASELWATGETPKPMGSAHRFAAPYQALRTRDGHITIGANSPKLWRNLCSAVDRAELATDERFATNGDRMEHRDELTIELESALKERDSDEWVEILLGAGIPAGPIRDYRAALDNPHTLVREMVVSLDHPVEGEIRSLGIPVKLHGTPGSIRTAAPLLGQHTDDVLEGVGIAATKIAALRRSGAIG